MRIRRHTFVFTKITILVVIQGMTYCTLFLLQVTLSGDSLI